MFRKDDDSSKVDIVEPTDIDILSTSAIHQVSLN